MNHEWWVFRINIKTISAQWFLVILIYLASFSFSNVQIDMLINVYARQPSLGWGIELTGPLAPTLNNIPTLDLQTNMPSNITKNFVGRLAFSFLPDLNPGLPRFYYHGDYRDANSVFHNFIVEGQFAIFALRDIDLPEIGYGLGFVLNLVDTGYLRSFTQNRSFTDALASQICLGLFLEYNRSLSRATMEDSKAWTINLIYQVGYNFTLFDNMGELNQYLKSAFPAKNIEVGNFDVKGLYFRVGACIGWDGIFDSMKDIVPNALRALLIFNL